jgi:hypothetical protein
VKNIVALSVPDIYSGLNMGLVETTLSIVFRVLLKKNIDFFNPDFAVDFVARQRKPKRNA